MLIFIDRIEAASRGVESLIECSIAGADMPARRSGTSSRGRM